MFYRKDQQAFFYNPSIQDTSCDNKAPRKLNVLKKSDLAINQPLFKIQFLYQVYMNLYVYMT